MGISELDIQYMQHALALARQAEIVGEVPVGAVMVLEQDIIAESFNQPIASHDPTAHAEIQVLRAAGQRVGNYRLVNTTLYVTLEPCGMCAIAMIHARVSRVVFGAADPKAGALGGAYNILEMNHHNHCLEVEGGVLQQEAAELLKQFFQRRRD